MTDLWMPGARRDGRPWTPYSLNGSGGSVRVALHTTENAQSAQLDGIADYMWNSAGPGTGYSLLFHPTTGDILQLRPADVGAGSLKNLGGGVETNRNGLVNVQISVCAYAGEDWDRLYPCPRWQEVVAWVRSLGVPDVMVSGEFVSGRATMSTSQWTGGQSGWYGHQHTPENDHTDPGPRALPWTIAATDQSPPRWEDDPYMLISSPAGRVHLLHAGRLVYIHTPADLGALQAILGPVADVQQDTWNGLVQTYGEPVV